MSSELRIRRGTSTEHSAFTGADSEITANTTNKSIHIHDGITAGGYEIARADLNNVSDADFLSKSIAAGVQGGAGGSAVATISNASQTNPVVITTVDSHGFVDGTLVQVTDVAGMTQLNGNAYYVDVLTSTTFALYTDANLTVTVNGTAFSAYTSSGEVSAAENGGAPISASYIVVNAEGGLPNDRRLQAGNGVTITDGGAGGAISVAAKFSSTAPSNLGAASAGLSNDIARADHVHAVPTATDIGAVPTARQVLAGTGLTGGGLLTDDITVSLSASANNLTDVTVSNPNNGDVLIYNSATSQFENSQNFAKNTILDNGSVIATSTINKFNFVGSGFSASVNGSDPSRIDLDFTNLLTTEAVQDIVGAMVTSNIESGIVVAYDDLNGKLDFNVNDPTITLAGNIVGSAVMTNLGDVTINTTIAANSVALGNDTTGNYVATFAAGTGLTLTNGAAGAEGAQYTLNMNLDGKPSLSEFVADTVGSMVSANTESGITVVYDDADNTLDFNVADFTITLDGDLTGAVTITDLANATLTASIAANSVALGTDTTGNYVATIAGSNGINVSGSNTESAAVTISVDTADSTFVENIQDIVGAMVSTNTEAGISVTYNDTNGKLNFDVNDPTVTLTGDVSGSGIMTNLGNVSISCTIQDDSHNHIIANVDGLQTALNDLEEQITAAQGGNFLPLSGGTLTGGIATQNIVPASNVLYNIGSVSSKYNTVYADTFNGTAVTANYADLAERYHSDSPYAVGTLVKLGGTKEITATDEKNDMQVLGVISENPAYLMNAGAGNPEEWLPVAMTGRVPVKVTGKVKKGQRIVSSNIPGVGVAVNDADITSLLCIIGRALEDSDNDNITLVECVVGKL